MANGEATVLYSVTLSKWVLLSCTGGALQVAPATQSEHAVQLGQVGHGQCRISVTNPTVLTMLPYNGDNLIINGVPQKIPQGGVSLSNAGLAASTLYYVYAFMTAGVMTLEAATTGHSQGANGVEIKTGDTTRTLVAMLFTSTTSQFVDSLSTRTLANWFNRRQRCCNNGIGNVTTGSVALTVLGSIANQASFVTWGDEDISSVMAGSMRNNTALGLCNASLALDGNTAVTGVGSSSATSAVANANCTAGSTLFINVAEGQHSIAGSGAIGAAGQTGTFTLGYSVTLRI